MNTDPNADPSPEAELVDLKDRIATLGKVVALYAALNWVWQLIAMKRLEALEDRPFFTDTWTTNRIDRLEQFARMHINPEEYTHHEP